ncbi:MAG TPA: hypothetical protein PK413_14165 [Thermoanaerobaculia bacterium]|nr:hypothetical protein [Thermoanaerobaculia bacterium]
MSKTRSTLVAALLAALVTLPVLAQTSVLSTNAKVGIGQGATLEEALAAGARLVKPEEVAHIETSPGNYVAFLNLEKEGRVQVAVAATFPNPVLVTDAFVSRHEPVEIYLAVAPLEAKVPSRLLALAPVEAAVLEPASRQRLKQENALEIARLGSTGTLPVATRVAGCTQTFKDWVGDTFGDSTCGSLNNDATTTHPTDLYCNDGPGGCENPLGSVDKGECVPVLKSCNIVKRTTNNYRQRMGNWNGNGWMAYYGHWVHHGAANCSGNGDIQWYTQRDDTVYGPYAIGVGGMLHWPNGKGTWNAAIASTNVTYGSWKTGRSASGSTYLYNKSWLANNAGTDDRAILCGDTYTSATMSDVSAPFCNDNSGNVSLCTGGVGSECSSACFHCVGGSCG